MIRSPSTHLIPHFTPHSPNFLTPLVFLCNLSHLSLSLPVQLRSVVLWAVSWGRPERRVFSLSSGTARPIYCNNRDSNHLFRASIRVCPRVWVSTPYRASSSTDSSAKAPTLMPLSLMMPPPTPWTASFRDSRSGWCVPGLFEPYFLFCVFGLVLYFKDDYCWLLST